MPLRKPAVIVLILIATPLLAFSLFNGLAILKSNLLYPAVPNRIVFFGDSITAAGTATPNGYVNLIQDALAQQYPERDIEVIGAGINGNKVTDLQARLNRHVLAKRPTHVVIYIGINDVWHFFLDSLTGTTPEAYEQGLQDLIARIQEAGAQVSLCTPSVIGEDPDSNASVNQLLMDYAAISRRVANTSDAHLCDLRTAFEQYLRQHNPDQAYQGILTDDGVHLNAAGNQFVANFLLEHLQPLFPSDTLPSDASPSRS